MDEKVMIGDYIGTIEEFMPGKGTYAEDGKIYAAKMGVKAVDPVKHVAEIKGKDLPSLAVGQTVFGEVMGFRTNMVTLIAEKIVGQKGYIDEKTTIYISNIADTYVEKPEEVFAIGDIVKAKLIRMENGVIDVSTKGDLGVVKAFCRGCRYPLVRSEKNKDCLECPSCRRVEKRKIAADYGNVSEY
jgi:exosome complex component CSL4